jgi:hypothetical protein
MLDAIDPLDLNDFLERITKTEDLNFHSFDELFHTLDSEIVSLNGSAFSLMYLPRKYRVIILKILQRIRTLRERNPNPSNFFGIHAAASYAYALLQEKQHFSEYSINDLDLLVYFVNYVEDPEHRDILIKLKIDIYNYILAHPISTNDQKTNANFMLDRLKFFDKGSRHETKH